MYIVMSFELDFPAIIFFKGIKCQAVERQKDKKHWKELERIIQESIYKSMTAHSVDPLASL